MKHIRLFLLIIMVAPVLASCKKFLDVNNNPNAPTQPPINGLLTRVTQTTAMNVFRVSNITSYYVQYLSSPNPASATDVYDPIDASGTWTALYDNMTDLYDLNKLAEGQGATQYQGVAKIMMAMNLQLVHNLWGAAPYSTAFSNETLTPTYDAATDIFQECLDLLDEGIVLVQQAGSTRSIPTSATSNPDLIHKGSTASWVRTAHALKARLLNQLSETGQYNTASIFTELAAAYTSTAHDAYITTFSVRNPWNQVALNNINLLLDGWLSDQVINSMNGTYGIFDPRIRRITDTTRFGDYRGTRNGRGRTGAGINRDECYINTTGYYSSANSPLFIITYEEMKFIEAEAALRSSDPTRAYNAYLEGIRANMNKMGVPAADRDAYVDHATVSVGSGALTLAHIFREKYKALFLMPATWDDARRFDYQYQGFQLPLNVVTSTFIRRLVYPSLAEVSRNPNTPVVTDVTQRLWWDQ